MEVDAVKLIDALTDEMLNLGKEEDLCVRDGNYPLAVMYKTARIAILRMQDAVDKASVDSE